MDMNSSASYILIVEDDDVTKMLLYGILENPEYQILEASNGNEAIKLFKKYKPDLVITDIIMPEKEGIETIKTLKQIDPDVKIIAISGGGTIEAEEYLKVAKNVGAIYTFEKPIDKEDLIKKVSSLLSST
jgi:YesN/AraC family two-component response regulator